MVGCQPSRWYESRSISADECQLWEPNVRVEVPITQAISNANGSIDSVGHL